MTNCFFFVPLMLRINLLMREKDAIASVKERYIAKYSNHIMNECVFTINDKTK